jgi:hypothetical protein
MDAMSVPTDSAWSATGFIGDPSRGITLGPHDWSSVRGDYSSWTWFSVDVTTRGHNYGAAVRSPGNLDKLKSLPAGTFLVNGKVMTPEEYQASVTKDFPCSPATK